MTVEEPLFPCSLIIKPDKDSICWTHFHVPLGQVGILQELPAPLRRKVSSFVGTLIVCGIKRLELTVDGSVFIQTNNQPARQKPFDPTLPRTIRENLGLLAWWLTFTYVRQISRNRKQTGNLKENILWICPDCKKHVKSERDFCTNPNCPSWNRLHLCTGDPILQPVRCVT